MWIVFIALAIWFAIGAVTAMVMRRRGHDLRVWLAPSLVLGLFAIPLAVLIHRMEPDRVQAITAGRPGTGPVDVLVGIDGSPESLAGADTAARLLGERLGRLTLATVVDYETANDLTAPFGPPLAESEAAVERLRHAARTDVETVLLSGSPAHALGEYADREGYDVLVVGCRGHGASKEVFGSVAVALSKRSPVPVLIVGAPVRAAVTAP